MKCEQMQILYQLVLQSKGIVSCIYCPSVFVPVVWNEDDALYVVIFLLNSSIYIFSFIGLGWCTEICDR